MKDRLIRYLAEKENFDIFSIEAQMQQSYLVENYTNGNSTLKEAMRNLGLDLENKRNGKSIKLDERF